MVIPGFNKKVTITKYICSNMTFQTPDYIFLTHDRDHQRHTANKESNLSPENQLTMYFDIC